MENTKEELELVDAEGYEDGSEDGAEEASLQYEERIKKAVILLQEVINILTADFE